MNTQFGSPPSALAVFLHGRRIGVITRLAGDRHIFAFEEDHVHDPGRPTLSLAFKSASGGLVTEIRGNRVRVPPFFSNLLPEGHLRSYLAARIRDHGARALHRDPGSAHETGSALENGARSRDRRPAGGCGRRGRSHPRARALRPRSGGAGSTRRTSRRYSACIPSASMDGAGPERTPGMRRPSRGEARRGARRSRTEAMLE